MGEKVVDLVRVHGGHAALDDLANYQPIWAPTQQTEFYGHRVHTVGAPDWGGTALVLALNLLAEADLADPTTDPEALYWLIQIARQTSRPSAPVERAIDPDYARHVWARMREAGRFVAPNAIDPGIHSDFVLAADECCNLAAACHSINTSLWGNTGLFVDGISIPDPACFQQPVLAGLGPGQHLPFPANPAIALHDGAPVLASSSIGVGLQVATLQGLHATLALGIPVTDVVTRPFFHGPDYLIGDTVVTPAADNNTAANERIQQRINSNLVGTRFRELATQAREAGVPREDIMATVQREFPQTIDDRFDLTVLQAVQDRGQLLSIRPVADRTLPRSFWGALSHHPNSPHLRGGRTPFSGGLVESY